MTGWKSYQTIRRLEELAAQLGFRLGYSAYDYDNCIGLYATEKLVIYADDAQLIYGTAEELLMYLTGWQQCKNYMNIIGLSNDKKIDQALQKYRDKIKSDKVIKSLTAEDC